MAEVYLEPVFLVFFSLFLFLVPVPCFSTEHCVLVTL